MGINAWLDVCGSVKPGHGDTIAALLRNVGINISPTPPEPEGYGVLVCAPPEPLALTRLRVLSRKARVLAVVLDDGRADPAFMWKLLAAGAADVLWWCDVPTNIDPVLARLRRWDAVREIAESSRIRSTLVGESMTWRSLVRDVIEIAAFTQAAVLVMGESGTGKELIARLIHDLDNRPDKRKLIVVDCTTLSPELSGSELFGHERGAFTGAVNWREGAFALANNGTLFLDEIGELPLTLQAQLLRVVQEHQYKPVGSNTWLHTEFRLVCATNRDLEAMVASGGFRGDLFYRIAGWTCRTPSLHARRDDVLLLAAHFLRELHAGAAPPEIDEPVRQYLQLRDYPGNVRDLRRVVMRLASRHCGSGPITIGAIPDEDRPPGGAAPEQNWLEGGFELAIRRAVDLGVGLREIGQAATEAAIRAAIEQEGGNLHRAAGRLHVTDRALQLRRANRRELSAAPDASWNCAPPGSAS
jgi:transcriptional regulator with GAF, ATPase, and Fis domain